MKREFYVLIVGLIIIVLIVIFPPKAHYLISEGKRIKAPYGHPDVDYARTLLYCGVTALGTGVVYFIIKKLNNTHPLKLERDKI